MNKQLTKGLLLNQHGQLHESGYATELVKEYNRNMIKAHPLRIKEWDYYFVGDDDLGIAFTIADNSYMSLISVTYYDFREAYYLSNGTMKAFTMGSLKLPKSSNIGNVAFKNKKIDLSFKNDGTKRQLKCHYKNFDNDQDLHCAFELYDEPEDSMVIAIPFKDDPKAFYYNQKINCLKASGYITLGNVTTTVNPQATMGVLDWGRGVWTYKNTWYWGSLSTYVDGIPLGLNLGYGFGDTSNASENVIIYDGKAHKTGQVSFNIPMVNNREAYLKPWTITSDDRRIELEFDPILDRHSNTDLLIIGSDQHQVFGRFSGFVVLDNQKKITFEDKLGFAEKVKNKW